MGSFKRKSLIVLMLVLFPAMSGAGPWPREKGKTFVSLSYSVATPLQSPGLSVDGYASIYLEHGIGRKLTFGLDAGMDPGADYTAIVFLRRPVVLGGGQNRFAVQAGLGAASASGQTEPLVQVGAAWGRGLDTRFGPGWAALDTQALYNIAQNAVVTKADLTLGLKPNARTKLMLQLQFGVYPGSDPYLRLAPSIARKFGERAHVELGAQIGLAGDDRIGLKLGTWLEF